MNKIKDKSVTHNIFRIQVNEPVICGFYCITFIEYMLAGKTFLDEMKHNYLMSKKCKNTCKYLNYVGQLLILASTVTGCISISTFASLIAIPVGIKRYAEQIKIFCNHCRNKKV